MDVIGLRRALQSAAARLTVAAGGEADARRAAEMRELAARLQALSVEDFSGLDGTGAVPGRGDGAGAPARDTDRP